LVDHTVFRIIQGNKADFNEMENLSPFFELKAIYKWGCDGSIGHSTYLQRFSDTEVGDHIFSICLVPLPILGRNNIILWQNERPSSTRFCRPIKIKLQKE